MDNFELGMRRSAEEPVSYRAFIERSRKFVESKGLSWDISVNEDGNVAKGNAWDLRILTESHARAAAQLNSFGIDTEIRTAAITAGWPTALVPQGEVLSQEVQEFIKAVVAQRCKEAITPRYVRNEALIYRRFFSVLDKLPWDVNSEDFNRFMELGPHSAKVVGVLSCLAKLMSEKMLSLHIPLHPHVRKESSAVITTTINQRKSAEKLPDAGAFHELMRIVFTEKPDGHQHQLRFCAIQLLTFTGLRINEILMLPADCLQWESHLDVVTGQPADAIGGVSRSLKLRYFGEKREEGKPNLLVEDDQWIPESFHKVVVDAVKTVLIATAPLRKALMKRPEGTRSFKTTSGKTVRLSELLFLVIKGASGELPSAIPPEAVIETIAESSFYAFLGGAIKPGALNIFTKYGKAANCEGMKINSHSLRHLMNTEFFRLKIPDTVITQHFGRSTVTQSHEYDHRSIGERLSFVQLPASANGIVKTGTVQETVAKMVVSGFAENSHIAKSFKRIQQEHGEEAAFEYLSANSDGFHVTPYGFCTTSFAVNPCVRHLKCFDDCKQYIPSGLKEHRVTLEQLHTKLIVMRNKAAAKPPKSVGLKNQIAHAEQLIKGVAAALKAQPGEVIFQNGHDHSAPKEELFK